MLTIILTSLKHASVFVVTENINSLLSTYFIYHLMMMMMIIVIISQYTEDRGSIIRNILFTIKGIRAYLFHFIRIFEGLKMTP